MRKPLLHRLFLPAVLLTGHLCSCSEHRHDSDAPSQGHPNFTLSEVKRAFAAEYASTPRTRTDGEFDENAVLDPLQIAPEWEDVTYRGSDTLQQAIVPFAARYDYRLLQWDENGRPSLSPLPHRLVVLKDSTTEKTSTWLYFEFPDPAYPGPRFSGTVLYTTLSGRPVSAGWYAEGTLFASASLLDDSHTWEENAEWLSRLLPPPDIHIARIDTRPGTRGVDGNNDIEPVEIIGHAPAPRPEIPDKPELPTDPVVPPFDTRNKLPVEAGGGNPDPSGPDKSYPQNPHITIEDDEIRPVLDSLYNDCMGQLIINAIKDKVTIAYEPIQRGSYTRPEILPLPTGPIITCFHIYMGQPPTPMSVMEELMHIYQGLGSVSFWQASMNHEVEAKLTWYIYMGQRDVRANVRKALGGETGVKHFNYMREHILLNNWQDPEFWDSYRQAANAIQKTIPTYQQDKYVFDSEYMDIPNLLKLLADCLNK